MNLRTPPHLAPLALALAFSHIAAAAEPVTIADIAPKNAFFVAGADAAAAMWTSFDNTGFKAIWDDPAFQTWFKKHSKETIDNFAADLETLGLKLEDLKRPTGPVGFAAWFTAGNNDDASKPPAILALADFGDNADDMNTKLVEAMEKADQQQAIDLSEKDHQGVTIYTARFPENDPEAERELDPQDDEDLEAMMAAAADTGPPFPELHYARADSAFLLSSEITAIENAIDRLKGDNLDAIADEPRFTDARKRLGPAEAYAVILAAPLLDMTKAANPDDDMGGFLSSLTGPLGFDTLHAAALGLRFDTDDAMMEQTYSIVAPEKSGIVALFDTPAMKFTPPAFTSAEAASIVIFQFNFPGVIPLANKFVESLPEESRAMVGQQVQAATMFFGPILANLGPEVCVVGNLTRPLTADSQQQVWAIRMRDATALQQALAGSLPMWGFESRDFQGNQIWSLKEGGFIPADSVALGLGLGWLFLGPPVAVENIMRQGGAADNPKLADEKAFKAATTPLDNNSIAYAFSRVSASLDWYEWYSKNFDKVLEAEAAKLFGDEPPADDEERQWRDDAKKNMLDSVPAWFKDPPPISIFRKHLGDTVLEIKSTDAGFDGRSLMLRPTP